MLFGARITTACRQMVEAELNPPHPVSFTPRLGRSIFVIKVLCTRHCNRRNGKANNAGLSLFMARSSATKKSMGACGAKSSVKPDHPLLHFHSNHHRDHRRGDADRGNTAVRRFAYVRPRRLRGQPTTPWILRLARGRWPPLLHQHARHEQSDAVLAPRRGAGGRCSACPRNASSCRIAAGAQHAVRRAVAAMIVPTMPIRLRHTPTT